MDDQINRARMGRDLLDEWESRNREGSSSTEAAPDGQSLSLVARVELAWSGHDWSKGLVGDKEPLSSLESQYEANTLMMHEKPKLLADGYSAFRLVMGDENGFFRAFVFGYLEHFLMSQDANIISQTKNYVESLKIKFRGLEHDYFVFEDTAEVFLEEFDSAVVEGSNGSLNWSVDLLKRMRTPEISEYIVKFLRFACAAEIEENITNYENMIDRFDGKAQEFCRNYVLPMDARVAAIHTTAISNALSVKFCTLDFDDKTSVDGACRREDTGPSVPSVPLFTLMKSGNRYSILYQD